MQKAVAPQPGDRLLLTGHGLYFALTGIWPLVHLRSFLFVTGPKTDLWLLKTYAASIAASGLAMLFGLSRKQDLTQPAFLSASAAAVLTTAETIYVAKRRISPVYLLDAIPESVVLVYWLLRLVTARRRMATARPE